MKRTLLNNNKGFSLVELMVVVAIIGILATIGIPQYQKFMAKSRQSEAKAHLNGIFQGENSFFTEYNGYTINLRSIGAGAIGAQLRYNAGFTVACNAVGYAATVTAAGGPPDGTVGTNSALGDAAVNTGGAIWYYGIANITTPAAGVTNCTPAVGGGTYLAAAWGNPTNIGVAANNADQFTINQLRTISYSAIGL
jgi:type IV pilus assembly protein PilA